jgi:putative membrane protein
LADVTDWLRRASFAVAAAAMVTTPLVSGRRRAAAANAVVAGLAGTSLAAAVRRWGSGRATVAAGATASMTFAIERVGTATGWPFGRYAYNGVLAPAVAGVPAAVPVAWFAMGLPAREVAHAVLGDRSTAVPRAVVGAAALTAWDLFLDPQMTAEGYWRWSRAGRYRGIPATNFAGWFLAGLGVMALLEVALPVDDPDPVAVGVYAWMAVMQTVGFAAFFRDPLVAAVGGAATLPLAVVALRRLAATGDGSRDG